MSGVGRRFGGNLFSAFRFRRVAPVHVVVKTSICFQCATPPLPGSYGRDHSAVHGRRGGHPTVSGFYGRPKNTDARATASFWGLWSTTFQGIFSSRSQRLPNGRGSLINTTLFLRARCDVCSGLCRSKRQSGSCLPGHDALANFIIAAIDEPYVL